MQRFQEIKLKKYKSSQEQSIKNNKKYQYQSILKKQNYLKNLTNIFSENQLYFNQKDNFSKNFDVIDKLKGIGSHYSQISSIFLKNANPEDRIDRMMFPKSKIFIVKHPTQKKHTSIRSLSPIRNKIDKNNQRNEQNKKHLLNQKSAQKKYNKYNKRYKGYYQYRPCRSSQNLDLIENEEDILIKKLKNKYSQIKNINSQQNYRDPFELSREIISNLQYKKNKTKQQFQQLNKTLNIIHKISFTDDHQDEDHRSLRDPFLFRYLGNSKNQIDSKSMTLRTNTKKRLQQQTKRFQIKDFLKIKQLGNGRFGDVFLVKHRITGFLCALKSISKEKVRDENITNQFLRELKIQTCLDHPNIIKLYGFFQDNQYVHLLLQVASSGQLYKIFRQKKRIQEKKVACIIKQVCEAVRYLHTFKIIHRDIKLQNIVIQDGIIKLCDFGWAVKIQNELRSTFCGTPVYISPEILQGNQYDQTTDLWSIGVLTYELIIGQLPFQINDESQLVKIVNQQISYPQGSAISERAKDFIQKILKKNPKQRPKISQLLQHQFLSQKIIDFRL